jgi:hypothetical protein
MQAGDVVVAVAFVLAVGFVIAAFFAGDTLTAWLAGGLAIAGVLRIVTLIVEVISPEQ